MKNEMKNWRECYAEWRRMCEMIKDGILKTPITAILTDGSRNVALQIMGVEIEKNEVRIFSNTNSIHIKESSPLLFFKYGKDARGKPIFLSLEE